MAQHTFIPPATGATARSLSELSREACLSLLEAHTFGRLAVTGIDGIPVIRPINYRFDRPSQSLVFQTAGGTKLHSLIHRGQAVFEIDGVSPEGTHGWSVIVMGAVETVVGGAERARLQRQRWFPLMPGAEGHWMRLRVRTLSGRRLGAAPGEPV